MENFSNDYRNWTGKWIWGQDKIIQKNVYYFFRKQFNLRNVPNAAQIYITADTKYKLYVNGTYSGYGSLQSQPYYQYYDVRDVTNYLKKGENCICVIVQHLGTMPDTKAGLLAELVDEGGNIITATDSSWKAEYADCWRQDTYHFIMNNAVPFQEHFDARKEPAGWKEPGFDDSGWEDAVVYRGRISDVPPMVQPWTRLVKRDIPFIRHFELRPEKVVSVEENIGLNARTRNGDISINLSAKGKPVKYSTVRYIDNLTTGGGIALFKSSTDHLDRIFDGYYNPTVLLDFGRVITAGVELEVEGPGGGIIDMGYAERLVDGEFNNAIEGSFADRYIMKDGKQIFTSFAWKGFRYVKLLFNKCFSEIKVKSVKAIVSEYPYVKQGMFESSDELLNDIHDICEYTIRLCSNECITDTPFREQGQWLGDVSAVTLGSIYSCFGDTYLPAKFLKQSAANQMPTGLITNMTNTVSFNWQGVIPDYSLWWVMAVWDYYMYTGQEEIIHEMYPNAVKVVDAFIPYIDNNGLVCDMPYWVLIDWANIDRRGECAALNAVYYGALKTACKMADIKNDGYTAEKYKKIMEGIKGSFEQRFLIDDKGVFSDANIEGCKSDMISEHTNAAAIYFGLCGEDTAEDVINRMYVEKCIDYIEAQPYFTAYVLQALKKMGRMDIALNIIRERWGKRMIGTGAKSTYEEWGQNGSWRNGEYDGFMRTNSHAWSAHPAEFLIKGLAGIEILEPGCGKIKVNAAKTDFDYSVVYPTPKGNVNVEWKDGQMNVEYPDTIK